MTTARRAPPDDTVQLRAGFPGPPSLPCPTAVHVNHVLLVATLHEEEGRT